MAEITAGLVKELRDKTDAPMMECKRALAEAAGDLAKAEEILRVKLGNKAAKASSRVAAEGVVAIAVDAAGKAASIIEINCETDFVAKNEDFLAFANSAAQLVLDRDPADVAALSALPMKHAAASGTVEAVRTALVGKIGENLSIRRFARIQAQGRIAQYIHGGAKIGALVDISGGDADLGRDIAMHIAASKPKSLDASGVAAELIETERRVAAEKAAEDAAKSGKEIPADIMAKRVEGSVQKYLKEVTLLGQLFVKNDKQSIEQLLKAKGATVHGFRLYVVGEGIERKTTDFAAEVAAQAAAARAY
jgi:elongation factor Ts